MTEPNASRALHPLRELYLARMREFVREPGVLFWVFGFPILLAIGLGIAFRERPADVIPVAVASGPGAGEIVRALAGQAGFQVEECSAEEGAQRLRLGHAAVLVEPGEPRTYRYDPTRPDGLLARQRVDDALQRAAGRVDPVATSDQLVTEPGARYIDFLIPGLVGMNIMSGGMWGVGFVIVEMRSRKLLKRLVATPMRKGQFLAAMMGSRMSVVFFEIGLLFAFGWWVFDLVIAGSLVAIGTISVLGAFSFSALGLLTAARAQKTETVAGLMNLVMLPMFVVSGVFFSADRFPDVLQPLIQALPLTALNDALRAVVLEGASLASQAGRLAVLGVWGVLCALGALRWFRWS
jgi:ABC-type multidrug transport system permease subunit